MVSLGGTVSSTRLAPAVRCFSSSCCAVDQVLAEGGRWRPPILPPGLIIATPQEIDGRVSRIAGAPLQLQVPVNAIFDADSITLTFAHADLIGHIEVLGDVLPDADAGGAGVDGQRIKAQRPPNSLLQLSRHQASRRAP